MHKTQLSCKNYIKSTGGLFAVRILIKWLTTGFCNWLAASSGGAVFGSSGANLVIAYGSVLSDNTAATGGAIHCDACQQLTMTTGAVVQSNHAASGGGAYCNLCECVLFQDVHFLSNRYAYRSTATAPKNVNL